MAVGGKSSKERGRENRKGWGEIRRGMEKR